MINLNVLIPGLVLVIFLIYCIMDIRIGEKKILWKENLKFIALLGFGAVYFAAFKIAAAFI